MNAIRVATTITEAMAEALPELRPLLGKHVEIVAREPEPAPPEGRKISFEELIAARLKPPPGTPPLTQEAIDAAIAQGAMESVFGR